MTEFDLSIHDPLRRRVLAALAGGCAASFTGPLWAKALCNDDPVISNLGSPLTIDTHAHFFNGRDLQVREFLSQTTVGPDSELYSLVNAVSGLLQALAWSRAPDAASERQAIARYAQGMQHCEPGEGVRRLAAGAFQEGYAIGRDELQQASARLGANPGGSLVLGAADAQGELGEAINTLPQNFEDFEAQRSDGALVLGSHPTVAGYLRFILHHFNYRHVNAIDYLTTYSRDSPRKIDLVVSSMVDYDGWLTKGRPTPTSLPDQVALMSEISVLLGGRVHGFVPFCPLREIMTMGQDGEGDSMRLVRQAVTDGGCIGVKLYPPMGFAAYGNAGRDVWRKKKTLPPVAAQPDFGKQLDAAMARLYTWCLAQDVPIMAHTNHSNGPYEDFRKLAGSAGWEAALHQFPGLSVSFGHFGDTDLEDHSAKRTRDFLALMRGEGEGARAFSDSGFFAGTLIHPKTMQQVLHTLYDAPNGLMGERLMYGSDWTMILKEKNVDRYLADFIKVIGAVGQQAPQLRPRGMNLADAFFGANATEFLGLRKGRGNRRRLEAFYGRHQVATPDWMRKVDGLA